jgi:hypothetical protein
MERENAEKREYEVLGRANELETRLDRLTILIEAALDSRNLICHEFRRLQRLLFRR